MGRPPLTKSPRGHSRERVFQFVKQRLLAGEPPTVRDVQQAMGFSAVASARSHLDALVTAGRLAKDPGRSRGFRLPIDDPDAHLVGSIVTVATPYSDDRCSDDRHNEVRAANSRRLDSNAPTTEYDGSGYISREPKIATTHFPAHLASDVFVSIPVLGQVQAGSLSLAVEEAGERIQIKAKYPANELFALRVAGLSMKNAGILPGDLAVIRKQPTAGENEIVVAMFDDQATIKRLTFDNSKIILKAENPEFDNITVCAEALTILGRLIQLQRSYS